MTGETERDWLERTECRKPTAWGACSLPLGHDGSHRDERRDSTEAGRLRVGQRVLVSGAGSGVIEEVRDRDVLINFGPRSAEHTDGSRCSTCSCERREWAYKQHVSLTVGERERLERRPA